MTIIIEGHELTPDGFVFSRQQINNNMNTTNQILTQIPKELFSSILERVSNDENYPTDISKVDSSTTKYVSFEFEVMSIFYESDYGNDDFHLTPNSHRQAKVFADEAGITGGYLDLQKSNFTVSVIEEEEGVYVKASIKGNLTVYDAASVGEPELPVERIELVTIPEDTPEDDAKQLREKATLRMVSSSPFGQTTRTYSQSYPDWDIEVK